MSDRIIGTYTSGKEGPLLFISAGVHGNEPSGVKALSKILDIIHTNKPEIKGTIVGVKGNVPALQKNVRYIDEDLNRTWTKENVEAHDPTTTEQEQMFEIIDVLNQYPESDFTKRYFLDCHTTSSDSAPYISVQEVNDNDPWAHQFPTYIIRGFSDIVYGCIDHYMSRTGLTGFVFEGGQHDSPIAIQNHEAIIWSVIREATGLQFSDIKDYEVDTSILELDQGTADRTFEIIHRFGIEDEDDFKMEPGYENFQKISKGEHLATLNGTQVLSEWDAFIFMPLYQAQGKDGFFVVECV